MGPDSQDCSNIRSVCSRPTSSVYIQQQLVGVYKLVVVVNTNILEKILLRKFLIIHTVFPRINVHALIFEDALSFRKQVHALIFEH